jgi:hypothetical protein
VSSRESSDLSLSLWKKKQIADREETNRTKNISLCVCDFRFFFCEKIFLFASLFKNASCYYIAHVRFVL